MASNSTLCFSAIMAQNQFQTIPGPDQEAFCQFNSVFLNFQNKKLKKLRNESDYKIKKGKKSNSYKSSESNNEHSDPIEAFIDNITNLLSFVDAYLKMLQDSNFDKNNKDKFA